MNKVKSLFLILFLCSSFINNALAQQESINWISFEEMQKSFAASPKPIIIDLYTDWCGWCKVMDNNTYKNQKLVKYINEKYYAVKFNAESRNTISFNNKIYNYDSKNRINSLAIYLTYGRLEFPHTILMGTPSGQPAPFSGYLKPAQMESPVKYYGENAYRNQTFVEFNKKLKKDW